MDGEIVNCDSVQVYRELNIGSAKVPAAEREGVAHHLLDIASFREEVTAGAYASLARTAIAETHARGKLPVIAGGTGFYLRALLEGLPVAPSRNTKLRERLTAAEEQRPGLLHRFLRLLDPVSLRRIHSRDIPKLIRAIEITILSGRPASQARSQVSDIAASWAVLKIGLSPPRPQLHKQLRERTRRMFANGLIEETRSLLAALGPDPLPRSLQTLGYKQAVSFCQGDMPLDQAIEQTEIRTRQYAKRQMTWFRADRDVQWINGFGDDPDVQTRAEHLAVVFLTPPSMATPSRAN